MPPTVVACARVIVDRSSGLEGSQQHGSAEGAVKTGMCICDALPQPRNPRGAHAVDLRESGVTTNYLAWEFGESGMP